MSALPKKINHLIGRAMHSYSMLNDGDKVLVAVSGGVDSLVLAWILHNWKKKAPIDYDLMAVHLDMGFDNGSWQGVEKKIEKIGLPYKIEKTTIGVEAYKKSDRESGCFNCSKNRRNLLFEMARDGKFSKIALGHHKDDIIETFFLNIFYSGNISTMVPSQKLFNGDVTLIRPLAFLEKEQVIETADAAGLLPVKNPCPMADQSKREEMRTFLTSLFEQNPSFKSNVFASLSNVRSDYLLTPIKKGA